MKTRTIHTDEIPSPPPAQFPLTLEWDDSRRVASLSAVGETLSFSFTPDTLRLAALAFLSMADKMEEEAGC